MTELQNLGLLSEHPGWPVHLLVNCAVIEGSYFDAIWLPAAELLARRDLYTTWEGRMYFQGDEDLADLDDCEEVLHWKPCVVVSVFGRRHFQSDAEPTRMNDTMQVLEENLDLPVFVRVNGELTMDGWYTGCWFPAEKMAARPDQYALYGDEVLFWYDGAFDEPGLYPEGFDCDAATWNPCVILEVTGEAE